MKERYKNDTGTVFKYTSDYNAILSHICKYLNGTIVILANVGRKIIFFPPILLRHNLSCFEILHTFGAASTTHITIGNQCFNLCTTNRRRDGPSKCIVRKFDVRYGVIPLTNRIWYLATQLIELYVEYA